VHDAVAMGCLPDGANREMHEEVNIQQPED
jgi:hypothetical protein